MTADVAVAAEELITAFGAHDTDRYFDCFAEDASYLFHNTAGLVTPRVAYEQMWRGWEAEGFRVLGCRSFDRRVQMITADTALFTHRVRTKVAGEPAELCERESILFRREPGGKWLAVHEHLSVDPDASEAARS